MYVSYSDLVSFTAFKNEKYERNIPAIHPDLTHKGQRLEVTGHTLVDA